MSTALQTTVAEREVSFVPFGATQEMMIRLNISMVQKFIANKTKSGAIASEEQCLKFLMLCKSRQLNPWEGDAYLIGYDGKDGPEFSLITAHQAFLKRAEPHPEFDGMESGVVVRKTDGTLAELQGDFHMPDQILVGGWAKVHFKTRHYPMYKKLRLATFDKGFGRWKVDPAGMIVKCCEADALRSAFPNTLGGMYLREEAEVEVESSIVAPAKQSRLIPPPQLPAPRLGEPTPGGTENSTAPVPPVTPTKAQVPRPRRASASPPVPPEPAAPARKPMPEHIDEPLVPQAEAEPPPEPDPLAEAPDSAESAPIVPEPEIAKIPISEDAGTNLRELRLGLQRENISEKQLLKFLVDHDLASPKQTDLRELNSNKIKGVCERFADVVAEIKLGF